FGFFHKQSELMMMLPQVPRLREVFELFALEANGKKAEGATGEGITSCEGTFTIDLSQVADCLRTMGLSPGDQWLAERVEEQLRRREALGPLGARVARRASFELVLSLYCQLASLEEAPTAEEVLLVLRTCDPKGTGMLPYAELRHMLTTMGDRLDEAEVFSLLHGVSDISGNVHYEHLVRKMFAKDSLAEETVHQARLYLQAIGRNAIDMDMGKRDEFIDALREADPFNTGYIETQHLLEVLNRSEEHFTGDELQVLTQGMADTEGKGRGINYRRFLRFIMHE
ncbi:hypothetical protein KR009_005047, partial [Drosophila setifemur]